ncbi:hypothetical protein BC830DRAFT_1138251 [Chytriomyces sp. MP71]|nr:hypothetical protein BC830DRAFT_1138251 [Chytriomyces sp. MP71]
MNHGLMVSELDKDDTSGFMKFLKLVEELVERIKSVATASEATSLPFSTEVLKELANPIDNRSRLIKEIVTSERTFMVSLEELHRLQNELAASKIFSKDMMQQLFSNLNELLDFQRRFMVGIESTFNFGASEHRIGQLFLLNEEAFEVYFPYCGNYDMAAEFVLEHAEELKQFNHIIPSHSISAHLIQPVQRLVRYPLLLKELIKLTKPGTYAYMDELNDGLESIKRVIEKLNETRRRDENERLKQDLDLRMEEWKGLQIRAFGDLLLSDKFLIAATDMEREYHLFLFEHILICCKRDEKQNKRNNRKQSNAGSAKDTSNYTYSLRGNIYISSIVRVEDASEAEIGFYSIRVYWKDVSDPVVVPFALKCLNKEQVSLWVDRMERQMAVYENFKKEGSANAIPMMLQHRGSNGYSNLMIAGDPNYNASILSSPQSQYGSSAGMSRSMSIPGNAMYSAAGMISPVSPAGSGYIPTRQGSFQQFPQQSQQIYAQQQFYPQQQQSVYYDQQQQMYNSGLVDNMGSGLNGAMMSIPVRGQSGSERSMSVSRSQPGQPAAYMVQQQQFYGGSIGSRGPNSIAYTLGGAEPRYRRDSGSSPSAVRRPPTNVNSNQVSSSREALDRLAALAASGLPVAGFSDDEDESEDEVATLAAQQQQFLNSQYRRKPSTVEGMMMGSPGSMGYAIRKPSNDRGFNGMAYVQDTRGVYVQNGSMDGAYTQGVNSRAAPLNPMNQVLPTGYQRLSNVPGSPVSFSGSNQDAALAVNPNFQFPPPPPVQISALRNNSGQYGSSGMGSPRSPNALAQMQVQQQQQDHSSPTNYTNVVQLDSPAMRRTPTAPSYLTGNTSATQPSSFIKIRTHYDGDILIIAMPVRGATLQELRNRVERKVNMMPHKALLSSPIRLTVKEEVGTELGGKEWKIVRVLETDEDVGLAFTTNAGFLNLFLS